MAIFISEAELQQEGTDVGVVVARAEAFIADLQQQLETQKARADAASISVEQTCGLIEQKYLSLTEQFTQLEQQKEQTCVTLERRSAELAQSQAQCHRLELEAITRDAEVERLSLELSESRKSKRELLDVVDQKNGELEGKNSSIKSYLDKIVALTDERSVCESRLHEAEAEVARLRVLQTRLAQEKELLGQHNVWLNEELTAKVSALLEERRSSAETEADLRSKLSEAERQVEDLGEESRRNADRNKQLDCKLSQLRDELKTTKEDASSKVEHLTSEIATATKLTDLYKESSNEWSKKSHDLEGVITALEAHLNQLEADYNEKLELEVKARKESEKESADLKEQLEKSAARTHSQMQLKEGPLTLTPTSTALLDITNDRQLISEFNGDGSALPPGLPLSGTALAASLLRDGWNLATIYSKYQEAVDKWRHEKQERHYSQSLLERVLHEIESKAEVIMDERDEHEHMIRAYRIMEEKLGKSVADQVSQENIIKDLKAEVRKKDRDLKVTAKEVSDLQTQVAVLLKECADIQQRFGVGDDSHQNGDAEMPIVVFSEDTAADAVISNRLLTIKDIRGMVEHNSQLRTLVRSLAEENEQKEVQFKETFELELKNRTEKLVQKVSETVEKQEEQLKMLETLQATVRMYKRLYEETNAVRSSPMSPSLATGDEGEDLRKLLRGNQEEIKKMQGESTARIKELESELREAKQEVFGARVEQARADQASLYAKEQLESWMKDFENQRKEMEALLRRNVEYSQTITDYQRKLRENAQSVQAAEEKARKLSIDVSVLDREKELLANAEKRAADEVASLSDRVHRLQATLDSLENVKAFHDNLRVEEMKRLETELNRVQKEWAEARRELESERFRIGSLTVQRDQSVNEAMGCVDAVRRELADAMKALSTAETRAQVAETRCTDLEMNLKKAEEKVAAFVRGKPYEGDGMSPTSDEEIVVQLQQSREALERVKEDLAASQEHTEQYKRIATANGEALKQIEEAHNSFKEEADRVKAVHESEILSLRRKLVELEGEFAEKEKFAASTFQEKEDALINSINQQMSLKEAYTSKKLALDEAEERIGILKKDVERLHHQWREAQNNYERQVLLQADTIRELSSASEKLSQLEIECRILQEKAETAEAELQSSKVSWEMEHDSLVSAKVEVEKKLKELNEQNQLLLDRLEARHILEADHAQRKTGDGDANAPPSESDLQSVIRFLRRSKETSDTELSLMKQERLRLQKQLEAALRTAEDAHTRLRREHESALASLHNDQDMKSLQAQVKELELLRESNAQLREEIKKNFDDSKESREKAGQAQADLEVIDKRLRELELDLGAAGKELEVQKAETERWKNRVSQLLEKYKAVDVEDYQRVKAQLAEIQGKLKDVQDELLQARKDGSDLQEKSLKLEQDAAAKHLKFSELERRVQELSQSETTLKTDLERFKRHAAFLKKKIEAISKEKEEFSKENDSLSKQLDDLKANAGRKAGEAPYRQEVVAKQDAATRQEQTDNLMKEQDARIQTLERTLERERDELRKEKLKRQKDQKAFYDIAEKAVLEKKRFLEEFHNLKQDLEQNPSKPREPAGTLIVEDRAQVYESAVVPLSSLASGNTLEATQLQMAAPPTAIPLPSLPLADSSTPLSTVPSASSLATSTVEAALVSVSMVTTPISAGTLPPVSSVPSGTEDGGFSAPSVSREPEVGAPAAPVLVSSTVLSIGSTTVIPSTSGILTVVPVPPPVNQLPVSTSIPTAVAARPSARFVSGPPRPPSRSLAGPVPSAPAGQSKEELDLKIQELRAHLLEKEKAQARKTTRKLVRPRIEPEVQIEVPESTVEVQPETTDMETDVTENRVSVTAVQDGLEVTLVATDSSAGDMLGSVPYAMKHSEAHVTTIASQVLAVGGSVIRKRSASVSDAASLEGSLTEQDVNSDAVPPLKKARPVDMVQALPMVPDLAAVTISSSALIETELTPIDGIFAASDLQVAVMDSTIVSMTDNKQMQTFPEVERERPASESVDVPATKKPRFIRPDSSTFPQQTMVPKGSEGEAAVNHKVNPSDDQAATNHSEDVVLSGGGEDSKQEIVDAVPSQDASEDTIAPFEVDNVAVERENDSGSDNQVPAVELFTEEDQLKEMPTALEPVYPNSVGTTSIVGDLQSGAVQTAEPPFRGDVDASMQQDAEVLPTDTADEKTVGYQIQESADKECCPDRDDDTEDGEIMTEVMESADLSGLAEPGNGAQQESLEETQLPPEAQTGPVKLNSDGQPVTNAVEAGHLGSRGDSSDPSAKPSNSLAIQSSASIEAVPVSVPGEPTDLPRQTRQSSRGTTINLAERARERAVLRRQVISPPSPGGRAGRGRGPKRATGPGRGRVISTGVRTQGQPEGPQGGGATSGTQGEGSQATSSNAQETTKDDQE